MTKRNTIKAMTKEEIINRMIEAEYIRESDRTYFMNRTKEHAVLTYEAFANSYSFKIRNRVR